MSASTAGSSPSRSPFAYVVAGFLLGAAIAAAAGWLLVSRMISADSVSGAGAAAGSGSGVVDGFGASPVDVVAAVETIAAESVQLLGSVAPVRQSLVASEVDGLVAHVSVDEGMQVQEGDVLVRLRTTTQEQQLAAARAAREETAARLARAEADFDRLERLLERQVISRREYDQAVADRDAFEQGVVRLEAEAQRLEELVERATVLAPFGGRVIQVSVEVGEWVDRGDEIVSLVDLSEVEVGIQVAERYITAVSAGFTVDVVFDALPGREYQGRIKAVVPQAIPEARTFPVLIEVRNRDLAIKGGMAARVMAQLGSPEPAILVAKDAIVRRGDQVLVFRVAPGAPAGPRAGDESPGAAVPEGTQGTIEQVSIDVGPARGQWRVVYGPIAAGDLLVVRGNERVFPGQSVVVANLRDLAVPGADPDRPIAVDPRGQQQ